LHLPHQREEARHQRKRGDGPLALCPAVYDDQRRATAARGQYAAKSGRRLLQVARSYRSSLALEAGLHIDPHLRLGVTPRWGTHQAGEHARGRS